MIVTKKYIRDLREKSLSLKSLKRLKNAFLKSLGRNLDQTMMGTYKPILNKTFGSKLGK